MLYSEDPVPLRPFLTFSSGLLRETSMFFFVGHRGEGSKRGICCISVWRIFELIAEGLSRALFLSKARGRIRMSLAPLSNDSELATENPLVCDLGAHRCPVLYTWKGSLWWLRVRCVVDCPSRFSVLMFIPCILIFKALVFCSMNLPLGRSWKIWSLPERLRKITRFWAERSLRFVTVDWL